MVKFSVVMIARRMNDYILEAMPYFSEQTFKDFEIILVLEENTSKKFPKTRIIVTGKASPAEARNIGVRNAKGEIIAFIDDDAYPETNWLEIAAKDLKDENLVAVGGPRLVPKNATFFQRVSNKVYELSSGKTGIRYSGSGKRKEIDDWPTCNFFARKADFLKVGGFDSQYWGGEDTQVCYSLLKTGKKMIYNPQLIIYHHPRKTLKQHLKQTFFWGMWRGFFMRIFKQSRQLTFFIPPIFILGVLLGGILSLFSSIISLIYFSVLAIYLIYILFIGLRTMNFVLFIPVMIVTILTHFSYGIGFWKGILSKNEPIKRTLNPSEGLKILKSNS